ncbi:MlaD family protein [Aldersonia kunmingensis]|uniref:MlaD family protein n=1 Tax=Aldersonia kunmingensis TaxID=408066 RepID=UPI000835E41D|nr:MlaD family protein [Aldersonia kunmingensis]
MTKLSIRGTAVRLSIFAAAMFALLFIVVQAIQRPVQGETDTYHATFTDVNGLKTGDDIRMYGVQVGKVREIELENAQASVEFTVLKSRPIYDSSVLAIRYQSLTGQRYIDVRQPTDPGNPLPAEATIPTDHTVPSFDITQLFNGLEPILSEISPGALNHFTESVLATIEGNGSGIGPALDAVEQLSRYVSDRQFVISTLVSNLATISDQIQGKSPYLVILLQGIADVFTEFESQIDGLIEFAMAAPSTMGPLNSIMRTLGFTETNNPDLRRLFPDPDEAVATLARLPALLQAMAATIPEPMPAGQLNLTCSKGAATVPGEFQVLIAGQRISICNP